MKVTLVESEVEQRNGNDYKPMALCFFLTFSLYKVNLHLSTTLNTVTIMHTIIRFLYVYLTLKLNKLLIW